MNGGVIRALKEIKMMRFHIFRDDAISSFMNEDTELHWSEQTIQRPPVVELLLDGIGGRVVVHLGELG